MPYVIKRHHLQYYEQLLLATPCNSTKTKEEKGYNLLVKRVKFIKNSFKDNLARCALFE